MLNSFALAPLALFARQSHDMNCEKASSFHCDQKSQRPPVTSLAATFRHIARHYAGLGASVPGLTAHNSSRKVGWAGSLPLPSRCSILSDGLRLGAIEKDFLIPGPAGPRLGP
jgi:hypothetical protein